MAEWIALGALVLTLVASIGTASWHISGRINECITGLTKLGAQMGWVQTALDNGAKEHTKIHDTLDDHGQKIVGLQGQVSSLDGRVTRIEDDT